MYVDIARDFVGVVIINYYYYYYYYYIHYYYYLLRSLLLHLQQPRYLQVKWIEEEH